MTSHPKQGVLIQFKLGKKQMNPLTLELLSYRSCMCIKSPLIQVISLQGEVLGISAWGANFYFCRLCLFFFFKCLNSYKYYKGLKKKNWGAIASTPLAVIPPQSYVTVTNSLPLLLQSLQLLPYLSICQGRFAIRAENVRTTQISPWVL